MPLNFCWVVKVSCVNDFGCEISGGETSLAFFILGHELGRIYANEPIR